MSTQADNYIPEGFAEEVERTEQEAGIALDEDYGYAPPASPVNLAREILYEAPMRFAFGGFAAGVVITILIFVCAFLLLKAL